MKKNLANMLTSLRIILSFTLLFFMQAEYQKVFLIIYTVAWFTDAIDGTVARVLKIQSEFGSKLDDIADTLLGAVMGLSIFIWIKSDLFMFLPYALPLIAIRIFNIFYTRKKYGRPYVIHTYGNKITSFIAFLLPITYIVFSNFTDINPYFFFYAVIIVGSLASFEEMVIHITSEKFNYKKKSIFITLPEEVSGMTITEDNEGDKLINLK